MEKTIDYIKNKRKVPEELKLRVKEFNRTKKAIINSLKEKPKSIPQIAQETGLPFELVTYTLITLRKYNEIVTDEIDDKDEYFFYKLSKEE